MLPTPTARPVTLASDWLVCTFFVVRLVVSPAPLTMKVSPFTPVAVKLLPAKNVVPLYTRVPLRVSAAGLIVRVPGT